ncbi:hypothetical protein BDR04DRAFT_1234703 [Suillus decipiens]|nr:hypothetical protein BDR04DRAFT_1234703 [Suillus decipiens]
MSLAKLVQMLWSPTSQLVWIVFGQTIVVVFAWAFIGEIMLVDVLTLPDHIVHLILDYVDLNYFVGYYFIALHICHQKGVSAPPLRADYTAQASYCDSAEHVDLCHAPATKISRATGPHIGGLCGDHTSALEVCTILNELSGDVFDVGLYSWSTLLLPTPVRWPVGMVGTELDLGSAAFVSQLNTDLFKQNPNSVQAPAFEVTNVLTLLSGIAAVDFEGGVKTSSMFSFNGVSYNQSTGGIVPVVEDYSGSSNSPGAAVGLAFFGGKVPVNTSFEWGRLASDTSTHQGIAQNYTVTQQGVTANVTCQPIDRSQNSFSTINFTTPGPLYAFVTWNATANCAGNSNSQIYFTAANVTTGLMDPASEGFLPVVVCPNPESITTFNPNKFYIFMAGLYKYSFLPTTVCEVVPYLTTVNVTYNGGIISVDPIATPGLTSNLNLPLSQYIATVITYQSGSNQAMTKNPVGDFLTAYGNNDTSVIYSELEDYWRGIVEFASTKLRSGYTASGVPSNMARSTSGTMYVMTYGWKSKAYTYIFLLVAITLVWGITVLAAVHGFTQEKIHASDPSFDFSDPIDLIMAAYGERSELELLQGDKDKMDDISVCFEDVPEEEGSIISKRLVVVPEALPMTALLSEDREV